MNQAETAATIRRFATFFQGLTAVADTLDKMQSLEESAKAAEQRVGAATSTLATMTAEMAAGEEKLADIRARCTGIIAETQMNVDQMLEASRVRAASIVAAADSEAASRQAAATADIRARMTAATDQLQSIGAQLADMDARRVELAVIIDERSEDLARLEANLVAARAAAAAMLGG